MKGLFAATALLFAGSGYAGVIMPGQDGDPADLPCDFEAPGQTCWTNDDNGNFDLDDLLALLGITDDTGWASLYKNNVGTGEEDATFEDNYSTSYANTAGDPADADITWDGNGEPSITCPLCYLVVKDGNQNPNTYIFDIAWWNGTDTLQLRNFWPDQGAISHVQIFGKTGGDMQVPEPGTLGLLGIAALGFGLVRRRKI